MSAPLFSGRGKCPTPRFREGQMSGGGKYPVANVRLPISQRLSHSCRLLILIALLVLLSSFIWCLPHFFCCIYFALIGGCPNPHLSGLYWLFNVAQVWRRHRSRCLSFWMLRYCGHRLGHPHPYQSYLVEWLYHAASESSPSVGAITKIILISCICSYYQMFNLHCSLKFIWKPLPKRPRKWRINYTHILS